ncbi:MAG: multicopper oxidase domain-containing protein [Actinomycetota bacterium]
MKSPMLVATAAALSLVAGLAIAPTVKSEPTAQAATADYKVDAANGTTVNVDLVAEEVVQEIAPGVKYHVWTFNGTAPGPVIRVQLGDTIHFTLTNDSKIGMQHSIDFHAAMTPWADLPEAGSDTLTGDYQPVNPGDTKTFDWVAMYPGVFMYHCGVPPVLQHISNGMYGAIIVEPEGLPAEREFVLVSSEFYPGSKPIDGVYEGDLDRMHAVDPEYVVFNGVADQYKTTPLVVAPNEPFRIWVMNAGPTLTNAFHVIGTMFNETHDTGNPANTAYGLQTFNIAPGSGAMFELQIPDPGLYPFVTHAFAYTDLGAVGLIKVDPDAPPAPSGYPAMADPFDGGLTPAVGATSSTGTTQPSGSMSSMPGMSMSPSASSAPSSPASAACAPDGTNLQVVALNSVFDATCLAAPAGKPFTIAFDNQDPGVPHNVAIYTDDSATESLFVGELVTGPKKVTYEVGPLDPGTYFFRCDVHPTTMTGTFVIA